MVDLVNIEAELARDLRWAIDDGQMQVAYQPLFELATAGEAGGVPAAVEALCRWHHPRHGMILPDRFIAIAERERLVADIDALVLATAAAQVGKWQHAGRGSLGLSVNTSPSEVDAAYAARVADSVDAAGLLPGTLVVEVTETPPPQIAATLTEAIPVMHEAGIAVSIDDFGGSATTLSMIEPLAIDEVKIDRSLTRRTDSDAERAIADLIAGAVRHGWRVVAEGIETAADLARSRARGCDRGQGYLWAAPVTPERIERMLGLA